MITCLVLAVLACNAETKQCVEIETDPFKVILTKKGMLIPNEVEDFQLRPTEDGFKAVFKYKGLILSGPAVCKQESAT